MEKKLAVPHPPIADGKKLAEMGGTTPYGRFPWLGFLKPSLTALIVLNYIDDFKNIVSVFSWLAIPVFFPLSLSFDATGKRRNSSADVTFKLLLEKQLPGDVFKAICSLFSGQICHSFCQNTSKNLLPAGIGCTRYYRTCFCLQPLSKICWM